MELKFIPIRFFSNCLLQVVQGYYRIICLFGYMISLLTPRYPIRAVIVRELLKLNCQQRKPQNFPTN